MRNKTVRITAAVLVLLSFGLFGISANMSGLEIMEQVYNRPSGDDMTATLNMTLTNSRGSTRDRSIAQYRSDEEDMEKKLMFFTAPADVRDTSFMSWSYADGRDDDQWIYLPALRRVKRISSGNQNDSFMGSDFTYDDLGERHPSEDTHTLLREEELMGKTCYVVESIPKTGGEDISRTLNWVVKDEWIGLKKEFYDDDGELYKELSIEEFEKISGFWVITDMTMRSVKDGTSTRISMEDVSFNDNLSSSLFTERRMKMGPPR